MVTSVNRWTDSWMYRWIDRYSLRKVIIDCGVRGSLLTDAGAEGQCLCEEWMVMARCCECACGCFTERKMYPVSVR